jgi:hypothetical protein
VTQTDPALAPEANSLSAQRSIQRTTPASPDRSPTTKVGSRPTASAAPLLAGPLQRDVRGWHGLAHSFSWSLMHIAKPGATANFTEWKAGDH